MVDFPQTKRHAFLAKAAADPPTPTAPGLIPSFDSVAKRVESAPSPSGTPAPPTVYTPQSSARWDAANIILRMIAGGAAVGALGRSTLGLRDMLTSKASPSSLAPSPKHFNPIPIVEDPVEAVKPRKKRKQRLREKSGSWAKLAAGVVESPYAGFTPEKHYGPLEGKLTAGVRNIAGLAGGDNPLSGYSPDSPWKVPATYALGIPGALMAGYAGFKGVDMYADRLRKKEREEELQAAKDLYQQELANLARKQASDSSFKALDELGDAFEKLASTSPSNMANLALSGYLPLAAMLALGGGILGHQYGKKRSDQETLEKAMERRALRRMYGMPAIASPDHFYMKETI